MVAVVLTNASVGSGSYALATWLFLRLLGLIYFAAFVSLALQVKGLIGKRGILPAGEFLEARRRFGLKRFWRIPTLCWLDSQDSAMVSIAGAGALLSLLLILGFSPGSILILLWVFYLSLFSVSRIFLGYQWDILLLETGFLAILAAPFELAPRFPSSPPPIVVWLLWWLLFRLMFSSGLVKLRSGDKNWRQLTALAYHYETQPLPTPFAWYFRQMPLLFHRISAAIMFFIELLVPWLIFSPAKYLAAPLFLMLMILIQLTGNYCFFNLLGVALSVLLLDDRLLLPILHSVVPGIVIAIPPVSASWQQWTIAGIGLLILTLSLAPLARLLRLEIRWPRPLERLFDLLEPFHLVNGYGLFSVMTTERAEIIVEGSDDGTHWLAYEFKWKPGDVRRLPRVAAPHQPRLDWQVWFAALGYFGGNPWFNRFLQRLLDGSPDVLRLLKENPFNGAPPRYIRAVLYHYRFATWTEHRANGAWWRREKRGLYCPVLQRGMSFEE